MEPGVDLRVVELVDGIETVLVLPVEVLWPLPIPTWHPLTVIPGRAGRVLLPDGRVAVVD